MELITPKQLQFVELYMQGVSKTVACAKAKVSPDTFDLPVVQAEIDRRTKELRNRSMITEEWIVEQLMEIASCKIGNLVDIGEDGPYLNFDKLTNAMKGGITSLEVEEYKKGRGPQAVPVRKLKIRSADRLRALEMLGKYLGMFKEKVVHSVDDDVMRRLEEGRLRMLNND